MKRHFLTLLVCLPLAVAAVGPRRADAQGPQLPGFENTPGDAQNGDVVPPDPPRFVTPLAPDEPSTPPRGLDPQPDIGADDIHRASPRQHGSASPGDARGRTLPPGQTNRQNLQPSIIRGAPSGRRPTMMNQSRPGTTQQDPTQPRSSGVANRRTPQPSIMPSPNRFQAKPMPPQQLPQTGSDPYEVRANRRTPQTNSQEEMRRRWYQPSTRQGASRGIGGQPLNSTPQTRTMAIPQTRPGGTTQRPYYPPSSQQPAPYYRGAPQEFTPREPGHSGPELSWEPRQSSLDPGWAGSMGTQRRGGALRNDPRPPWESQPRRR